MQTRNLERPQSATMELPRLEGIKGYYLAFGCLGVALVCRLNMDHAWGDRMAYTTFFVASLVCITLAELGPALFSIISGLILANWFFNWPGHLPVVVDPERTMKSCLYLTDAGIVLSFATWARRALKRERVYSGALEESEKRFQTLAEAAFEGILLTREGRIIDCNDQVGALVGYTREELLGKVATDFISAEQRPAVQKNIREELPAAYELELLCKDGSRCIVEAHGRPIRGPGGEPLRVSVIRDISERKRWEESMRRRTEELERLMDVLPVAVWIAHDRECATVTGNGTANRLIAANTGADVSAGDQPEKMIRHFSANGAEYKPEELPLQRAAATGKALTGAEVEFRFGEGKRAWLLGSAEPLFDEQGVCRGAVAAFVDETERKEAEEALRATRDELAVANDRLERRVAERTHSLEEKTAELNAFCYSLAHDFRAPLRTQEGFARILVEDYGEQLGEQGLNLAQRVLLGAKRQSDIIQDLQAHISVTRSELPLATLGLKEAFEQVRTDLAAELQERQAEIHHDQLQDAQVVASRSTLHLILLNLLTNALKFVPRERCPNVTLRTERVGDSVRLWIEDNGIGISAQDIGKLFSMFHRLNPNDYPGTGMGLAIVKQAAERMGGRVGVESEPGQGSRFWVELKAAG